MLINLFPNINERCYTLNPPFSFWVVSATASRDDTQARQSPA